jgi:hypothetical protein
MGGPQRRGVIRPITGDGDEMAVADEGLHDAQLLLRFDTGKYSCLSRQRIERRITALLSLFELRPGDDFIGARGQIEVACDGLAP